MALSPSRHTEERRKTLELTATVALPEPRNETNPTTPTETEALPPLTLTPGAEEAQRSVGTLAVVSVLAANPVAMLQLDAVASVMDMASCAEGSLLSSSAAPNATSTHSRPYDISNNPLHLFIGADSGAAERGALLSCVILMTVAAGAVVARSAIGMSRGGDTFAIARRGALVVPFVGLPLLGAPAVLLLPAAFALRIAVRAGARLTALSEEGGDIALGVVALGLCGAYIAHVAYALSPLAMPRGVRCYAADAPGKDLPPWHRRLEGFAGPSCLWADAAAVRRAQQQSGGEEGDVQLLPMDADAEGGDDLDDSLLLLPQGNPDGNERVEDKPPSEAEAWLAQHRAYVAKARHYAWYSPLQLLTASVLKGLAAAQTEASCLARNAVSLLVLAGTLLLLVLLKPRPVPSAAGWCLSVVSNALLLLCAALNTANAAAAEVSASQPLASAVVWIGYAVIAVSAAGTALSATRVVVMAFPQRFGTNPYEPSPFCPDGFAKGGDRGPSASEGVATVGAALLFGGDDAAVVVGTLAVPLLDEVEGDERWSIDDDAPLSGEVSAASPLVLPSLPRTPESMPRGTSAGPEVSRQSGSTEGLRRYVTAAVGPTGGVLSEADRAAAADVIADFRRYEAELAVAARQRAAEECKGESA